MPPAVELPVTGTMRSPWPPSTMAVMSLPEMPSSWAMKRRMRAESSTPAMPMTRLAGNWVTSFTVHTMGSRGLVTTMM